MEITTNGLEKRRHSYHGKAAKKEAVLTGKTYDPKVVRSVIEEFTKAKEGEEEVTKETYTPQFSNISNGKITTQDCYGEALALLELYRGNIPEQTVNHMLGLVVLKKEQVSIGITGSIGQALSDDAKENLKKEIERRQIEKLKKSVIIKTPAIPERKYRAALILDNFEKFTQAPIGNEQDYQSIIKILNTLKIQGKTVDKSVLEGHYLPCVEIKTNVPITDSIDSYNTGAKKIFSSYKLNGGYTVAKSLANKEDLLALIEKRQQEYEKSSRPRTSSSPESFINRG